MIVRSVYICFALNTKEKTTKITKISHTNPIFISMILLFLYPLVNRDSKTIPNIKMFLKKIKTECASTVFGGVVDGQLMCDFHSMKWQ